MLLYPNGNPDDVGLYKVLQKVLDAIPPYPIVYSISHTLSESTGKVYFKYTTIFHHFGSIGISGVNAEEKRKDLESVYACFLDV